MLNIVPPGPVQEYAALVIVDAVNCKLFPAHTGELFPATGGGGIVFTITFAELVAPVQPLTVALIK